MLKRTYQFGLVLALVFGMVACGGEKPAETTTPAEPEATEETPAATEEPEAKEEEPEVAEELVADVDFDLAAIGETMPEMAYEPAEFTVEAYVNLKLNFSNNASTAGMNHNAVIVPMDEAVANEIRTTITPGTFDPTDDRVIAKTKVLEPGENTSIVFETPGPGKYYVICTYPGHQNMVATMIVE